MTYSDEPYALRFEMAMARPEKWCISGRCDDTNWGGKDRLHMRGGKCPDYRASEIHDYLDLARKMDTRKAAEAAEKLAQEKREYPNPLARDTVVIETRHNWDSQLGYYDHETRRAVPIENADMITSQLPDGRHAPILDLDIPHRYVPSKTPGHGHLFIDVPMSREKYFNLLRVLEDCGIIEPGYRRSSVGRGMSCARLPWSEV